MSSIKDKRNTIKFIPDVLKAMNETNDILEITEYENMLACMFASPTVIFGALVNYIFGYLVLHRDFIIA